MDTLNAYSRDHDDEYMAVERSEAHNVIVAAIKGDLIVALSTGAKVRMAGWSVRARTAFEPDGRQRLNVQIWADEDGDTANFELTAFWKDKGTLESFVKARRPASVDATIRSQALEQSVVFAWLDGIRGPLSE